eukprot:6211736-Pleurochrysis_carterae.AAC.1
MSARACAGEPTHASAIASRSLAKSPSAEGAQDAVGKPLGKSSGVLRQPSSGRPSARWHKEEGLERAVLRGGLKENVHGGEAKKQGGGAGTSLWRVRRLKRCEIEHRSTARGSDEGDRGGGGKAGWIAPRREKGDAREEGGCSRRPS